MMYKQRKSKSLFAPDTDEARWPKNPRTDRLMRLHLFHRGAALPEVPTAHHAEAHTRGLR